jgi:hypothetical protein
MIFFFFYDYDLSELSTPTSIGYAPVSVISILPAVPWLNTHVVVLYPALLVLAYYQLRGGISRGWT